MSINPDNLPILFSSNEAVEFSSDLEISLISLQNNFPKKIRTFPLKIKQIKTSENGNLFDLKEKNEELLEKRNENIQRQPCGNFQI